MYIESGLYWCYMRIWIRGPLWCFCAWWLWPRMAAELWPLTGHITHWDPYKTPKTRFQYKDCLASIEFPIIKIRWSWDHLIFIMGNLILVRECLILRRLPELCSIPYRHSLESVLSHFLFKLYWGLFPVVQLTESLALCMLWFVSKYWWWVIA